MQTGPEGMGPNPAEMGLGPEGSNTPAEQAPQAPENPAGELDSLMKQFQAEAKPLGEVAVENPEEKQQKVLKETKYFLDQALTQLKRPEGGYVTLIDPEPAMKGKRPASPEAIDAIYNSLGISKEAIPEDQKVVRKTNIPRVDVIEYSSPSHGIERRALYIKPKS